MLVLVLGTMGYTTFSDTPKCCFDVPFVLGMTGIKLLPVPPRPVGRLSGIPQLVQPHQCLRSPTGKIDSGDHGSICLKMTCLRHGYIATIKHQSVGTNGDEAISNFETPHVQRNPNNGEHEWVRNGFFMGISQP